jgi:hypothetical protein
MMICQRRQWSPNVMEARRKQRKDIYQMSGYNLLSKIWSREEREKQNRNNGSDVEKADEARRGNKDDVDNKIEESADEINSSTFTLTKENMLGDIKMWAVQQRQQGVIKQGEKRKDRVKRDKKSY